MGVAVSGGGDSIALLVLAHDWATARGRTLQVFTVDHQLRPEAAEEAAFVSRVCAARGIPHQTLVWATPMAKQAAARRARHALMAEALKAAGGTHLLLGHTIGDQCETFLMRARQGSTWYGLAGMQERSLSPVWPEGAGVTLARPLLRQSRVALRDLLLEQGQVWVEDPSNENSVYERVRVRRLLSQNPRLSHSVLACLARFQLLRRLEERLIAIWMRDQVKQVPGGGYAFNLEGLPPERAGRALGLMLQMTSGREAPPRRDALQPLTARLLSETPFRGATLGGVMVNRKAGICSLRPEPAVTGNGVNPALSQARLAALVALFLNNP